MTLEQIKAETEKEARLLGQSCPGLRFLVTAGPTFEDLDEVRFLGNRSSGRQGVAIASAALAAGHSVLLVLGPCAAEIPAGARVVRVRSALEMLAAVETALPCCDALVMAAAVADYRPAEKLPGKLHKADGDLTLRLVRNPDILKSLLPLRGSQIVAGFSLDAGVDLARARRKMSEKRLDLIVANSTRSFGGSYSDAELIFPDGEPEKVPGGKAAVAEALVRKIEELSDRKRRTEP